MRIIYFSPHPNLNLTDPAGYGTHMREMIAAFRAKGHEVLPVIMGGTEARSDAEPLPPSLIRTVAKALIPKKRWQTLKDKRLLRFDQFARKTLEEAIVNFKPDFIYERGNYLQVSGVRAASAAGIVHFMEMNSPYTEEKKELEGDSHLISRANDLEKEQLKETNHNFVVSSSLRDFFMEKHHFGKTRFTVVPNAIDPEKLTPDSISVLALSLKYGLEGKTVIGWVGSIQPWHGVDTMIRAFERLPDNLREDTRLLIVGSGESIEEMKALAAAGPAAKQILFSGYVPHKYVFAHIANMDICLLPNTKWYCSPIKIFEYGAMQKAIVASNHAAVLDVMEPDLDGLVIDPTPEALTDALAKLIPKPELRERYGKQFYDKVMSQHIWAANAQVVLEKAEEILGA